MASIKIRQGDEWVKIPNIGIVQGVEEAPVDDKQYARMNGAWSEIKISTDGSIELKTSGEGKTFLADDGSYKATQLTFTNSEASTWVDDTTYADYSYKCDIACEGVLSTDYAEVVYGLAEATSGNYAPICATIEGYVTIYSKVNDTITIPTIIIHR